MINRMIVKYCMNGFRAIVSKLNRLTLELMVKRNDIEHLVVRYRALIENPRKEIGEISAFLGASFDIDAGIVAVDTALYRNRAPL
jgi:hypothetical protein